MEHHASLASVLSSAVCNPPCIHGACVRNNSCSCSAGYVGTSCTNPGRTNHVKVFRMIEICDTMYFVIHALSIYVCVCLIFDLVYEDCDVNLCQNGATCQRLGDSYLCLCPFGFNGSLCNEGRVQCKSSASLVGWVLHPLSSI